MANGQFDTPPGEYCENGPYVETWTCPNCHHDHEEKVTTCASCGIPLHCSIERHPVARCTVSARHQGECRIRTEQDEKVCVTHRTRWGEGEDPPESCAH